MKLLLMYSCLTATILLCHGFLEKGHINGILRYQETSSLAELLARRSNETATAGANEPLLIELPGNLTGKLVWQLDLGKLQHVMVVDNGNSGQLAGTHARVTQLFTLLARKPGHDELAFTYAPAGNTSGLLPYYFVELTIGNPA